MRSLDTGSTSMIVKMTKITMMTVLTRVNMMTNMAMMTMMTTDFAPGSTSSSS